jgi:hypothetical protein
MLALQSNSAAWPMTMAPGAQDEDALQVGALGHLSLQFVFTCACASAGPSAQLLAASRRGVPIKLSVGAGI